MAVGPPCPLVPVITHCRFSLAVPSEMGSSSRFDALCGVAAPDERRLRVRDGYVGQVTGTAGVPQLADDLSTARVGRGGPSL